MAVLKGLTGSVKDLRYSVVREETTLGRHGSNMVVLEDEKLSAFHCAMCFVSS